MDPATHVQLLAESEPGAAPLLRHSDSQHLTAVFRIAGSKDAAREFLHQLANNYPGHEPELPELVAVQVGDALSKEAES